MNLDDLEATAFAMVVRKGLSCQRRAVYRGALCDLLIQGCDTEYRPITLIIFLRNWTAGYRTGLVAYATREAKLLLGPQATSLVRFLVPGNGPVHEPMLTIEGFQESLNALNPSAKYRSVAPESSASQLQRVAFCAMPFHEDFLDVYEFAIAPAVGQVGFVINRVDQTYGFAGISRRIWDGISDAQFVIADVSGCNPNVMYEIGLAHGLGTKTFLIHDSSTCIPFDIKDSMSIEYDRNKLYLLARELPPKLKQAIQQL